MGVHDVKSEFNICDAPRFSRPGVTHERGQDAVCASHGVRSVKTFGRIVERHGGDAGVRALDCASWFRVMAFSQLTWRESLRDIETCLGANHAKLFHRGRSDVPARSTLSDALNGRNWRIYHALARRLMARARTLYAKEPMSIELDATV